MRTLVSMIFLASTAGLAMASSSVLPRTLWERSSHAGHHEKKRELADTDNTKGLLGTVTDLNKGGIASVSSAFNKLFGQADMSVGSVEVFKAAIEQFPILGSTPSYVKAQSDGSDLSDTNTLSALFPKMIGEFMNLSTNLLGAASKGGVNAMVASFLANPDDETHELTQAVASGDQASVGLLQQKFLNSAFGEGLDLNALGNGKYMEKAKGIINSDANLQSLIGEKNTLAVLSDASIDVLFPKATAPATATA